MSEYLQIAVKRVMPLFARYEVRSSGSLLSGATATKHASVTIVLHWTTVMAIVVAVAAIYLRDISEEKVIRQLLLEAHRQLGLLVLVCVPLRVATRYLLGFSDQTVRMTALLRWVAAMTHLALYAFLIALPLLGWAATSAKGVTLRLFAFAPLPALVAPDPDLADALVDYHTWGAWALLALVAAHAFAALWHHFVHRDGVLTAMLPSRRSSSSAATRHRVA